MKDIPEVLEDIQEASIEVGGRFIRQSSIRKMTVGELLELLIPNNVQFIIRHQPPKYTKG